MPRFAAAALFALLLAACTPPVPGSNNGTCTPSTCSSLNARCGSVSDGCGNTLTCGTCTGGLSCGAGGTPNVCGVPCVPVTCGGRNCGTLPDGCGNTLSCGTCGTGLNCGGGGTPNVCGVGSCMKTTCLAQNDNCGVISDGCGSTLSCGTCGAGQTCGNATNGTPNVCSGGTCSATTCMDAHAECGSVSNGCGGMLDCGTCPGALSCGGGGTANVCGGQCEPACPPGYQCDTSSATCAGGASTQLTFDVTAVTVGGTITLNGNTPDSSHCSYSSQGALATFVDSAQGYAFSLPVACPSSGAWTFTGLIYAGTYDVTVAGYDSILPSVPFSVATGLSIQTDTAGLDWNVKTFTVSGAVTLNGSTPASTHCSYSSQGALATFTDTAQDYTFSLAVACPSTGAWTFSGLIYPGTYDVTVAGYDSILPSVSYRVASGLAIQANTSDLDWDVKTYTVSGVVTLNGSTPDASKCSYSSQGALATFTEKTEGYTFSLPVACPSSGSWTFSGLVYAGTYVVTVGGYDSILPSVPFQVDSGLVVQADVPALAFNLKTYTVAGSVTLNGSTPDPTHCSYSSQGALATLTDTVQNYTFSVPVACPSTGAWTFSGLLYPGTYAVTVAGYDSILPSVPFKVATGLAVQANTSGLSWNVQTFTVAGSVTLNGNTPDPTHCSYSSQGALATFTDKAQGYSFSLPIACPSTGAWTFSGLVYAGTYSVTVAGYDSILPDVPFVVATGLSISANMSSLTWNVQTYTVAGTVTLNGMTPDSSHCSYSSQGALATFIDSAQDYSFSIPVACPSSGPWTFSGLVYSGTYEVTVAGYDSILPSVPYEEVSRLEVP